jgi:hypothetical protein
MLDNDRVIQILIGFGVTIIFGLWYKWFFNRKDSTPVPEKKDPSADKSESRQLQLQAYERLTLLADRIAIPNLIARFPNDGKSLSDYQLQLLKNIRDEFDYNITQQIYVSPESWQAVKKLKEKNMLIINQVAQALPPGSSGLDLSRSLLHFCMQDEKGSLHELVSEALSHEARKLM